jgi:two-component system sensor histidine kinase/response regulator
MVAPDRQLDDRPTILVVDDEPRCRKLIRMCLEPTRRVLEAENGADALAVLEREQVDLVLLDVSMPVMNGLDACRAIKARHSRDRFLPVVLLTGRSSQDDRDAGFEAGADDFIVKPFDRDDLLHRVASFLRLRAQEASILRRVDQLTRLERLKGDLFALVVHDMRNPLHGARGFLHMVAKSPDLPDSPRRWLQSALVALCRVEECLDDVLKIRTLEAERLPLEREPTPLASVVREALETLEGAMREKALSVSVVEEEAVAAIDRKLVRRSIENILMNALEYSAPCGRVDVTVLALDGRAEVEVADRGPGVPQALKTEIFEKFTVGDPIESRQRRGYGLGLYLVKLVATAHGGAVTVRDREGGGSVFRLSFPRNPPS